MRTLLALAFIALFATHSNAQVLAYVVGGPAGASGRTTIHAAAGTEVIAGEHASIGGELGLFDLFVVGSLNATLHLGRVSSGRMTPFVTGGYSALWRVDDEIAFRAFHVGAGAHFWLRDLTGLRLEFRNHIRPVDRGATQFWSLRAGVAFR